MRPTRALLPLLAAVAITFTVSACQKETAPAAAGSAQAESAKRLNSKDKTSAPGKSTAARSTGKALAKAQTTPPTTTLDIPKPGATPTAVQNSRGRGGRVDLHDRIYRRVRSKLRRVNACYALQRRRDPQLAGKLTVEMTVAPAGRVSGARVVSRSLNSARLEGCVVATVKGFHFDPLNPRKPVTLVLPLVFR